MASEFAAMVHGQLRQTTRGKVCPNCLAAELKLERWDVMKGIRDLILTDLVRAEKNDCDVCHRHQRIVRLLPPYQMGSRR